MPLRRFHLIMKCLGFSFSGKAKERRLGIIDGMTVFTSLR